MEMQDPELRRLALKLPDTVLKARASSTTKKYLGAYGRWKEWVTERFNGKPALPVELPVFSSTWEK